MTNSTALKKEFSIENFKELFEKSGMKKYMPEADVKEIERAIEEKDEELLKNLYETLLKEQEAEAKIYRDFEETKNDIIDDFMVDVVEIKKKYIEKPRKDRLRKAEADEKAQVEDILNKLK